MSFYVEKVKRKKSWRYRIVEDSTQGGVRKRKYNILPEKTTKAQAEEICHEMALSAKYGNYIQKAPITLGEYVEEKYFPKYTRYLSATTVDGYRRMYFAQGGIKDVLGNLMLQEITTEILQDMVNQYDSAGISPKTIRNRLSFVSNVLSQAMSDNYMKRQSSNPCTYVRLPKLKETEGNAYTMKQVLLMLERARQTENRAIELLIVICCLAGGLRRGELIGLCWDDIVLTDTEAYIHVQRTVIQTSEGVAIKEPKTKSGKRIIPVAVGGTVYQTLVRARKEHLKLRLANPHFEGENKVFILNRSPYTPLTLQGIYGAFKRFMKKTCPDLPCYRLHDLRHPYVKPTTKKFTTFLRISGQPHSCP
ncbi:tyrosine-type recombinase/integrase [Lachnospiraceae bacterium 48-42]